MIVISFGNTFLSNEIAIFDKRGRGAVLTGTAHRPLL
jgi:hypothetical protein